MEYGTLGLLGLCSILMLPWRYFRELEGYPNNELAAHLMDHTRMKFEHRQLTGRCS